jgi:transposase
LINLLRMKRRKFSSKFKTKVIIEALKERETVAQLAQKFDLHPNQISTWKKEFLSGAEHVFEGKKPLKSESEEEKDRLLKTICQLKIEVDFLRDALR